MSLASNATDQQVSEILKAIQDVTPEVIEQAMQYSRVVNSVWLGIFLLVGLVLAIVFCWCLKLLMAADWFNNDGYILSVLLSGCAIAICLIGSAACINNLIKLSIAPDYYAVECLTKLFGR